MSNAAAAQWVKFFNASGIPSPAAASYAHIFVENRIQNDMLMDLNKEYLREMGITPMGDIIAILRHAKNVSDQTAREKVLTNSEMCVPVAAVPANPHLSQERPSTTTKVKLKSVPVTSSTSSSVSNRVYLKSSEGIEAPLPKQPRRVLPEHEGKYKIKLPSGSTRRSKEILANKEKLYSDREGAQRSHVFERLAKNSASTIDLANDDTDDGEISSKSSNSSTSANIEGTTTIRNVRVRITGVSGNNTKNTGSSSIFSRLGGKTQEEEEEEDDLIIAKHIKPILKNAPKTTNRSAIVKAKSVTSSMPPVRLNPQKQKVILVKKVPLKTNESDDDDNYSLNIANDVEMDDIVTSSNTVSSSEKIVKFASTAEVHEIAPEPRFKKSPNERNFKTIGGGNAIGGVKSRLGLNTILHTTKKTYNLKASHNSNQKSRLSPVKVKSIRLKSDEILMRQELPVHRRLGGPSNIGSTTTQGKSVSALSRRIGRVNISKDSPAKQRKPQQKTSTSVFDRLGFNS